MSKKVFLPFIGFLLFSSVSALRAQEYKVFAVVSTVDNQQISGYLTWGTDQMYWIDFFKAVKPSNPFASWFSAGDHVPFYSNGRLSTTPPIHLFCCRFGEIKSIELTGPNQIDLEVRDGNRIHLNKGSEPSIGQPLSLLTAQQEQITVRWEQISRIEFMTPPASFTDSRNLPITGSVKTPQGIFKGFVTWDRHEKTRESLMDGYSELGNSSVAFREIRKITKTGDRCRVMLQNGEEKTLWGGTDASDQNRGILVNMPNIGLVSIPWSRFETFEACDLAEISTLSYTDFGPPVRLVGEIKSKSGPSASGTLAFDLDESMDFEILSGKNDHIQYEIPFRYIRSIEPKNYLYSYVTLTNGSALSLGEQTDVCNENSGTLVFQAEDDVVYIPWKNTESVVFRH